MTGNESELDAKQERAVLALLEHPTITKAAKAAKVAEATLHRWLADDAFQAAYRAGQARVWEGALSSLQAGATEAAACLRAIVGDENAPTSCRLTAARTILEMGLKAKDALDTDARLTALEAVLTPEQGGKK